MNTDELKKEAEEYWIEQPPFTEIRDRVIDAYISSAEPREKQIADLEKENAELKNKLEHRNCLDCSNHSSKLRMKTLELEKECTKATEIIKKLYAVYYDPCVTESDLKYRDELFAEIKQFLSEVEK